MKLIQVLYKIIFIKVLHSNLGASLRLRVIVIYFNFCNQTQKNESLVLQENDVTII